MRASRPRNRLRPSSAGKLQHRADFDRSAQHRHPSHSCTCAVDADRERSSSARERPNQCHKMHIALPELQLLDANLPTVADTTVMAGPASTWSAPARREPRELARRMSCAAAERRMNRRGSIGTIARPRGQSVACCTDDVGLATVKCTRLPRLFPCSTSRTVPVIVRRDSRSAAAWSAIRRASEECRPSSPVQSVIREPGSLLLRGH